MVLATFLRHRHFLVHIYGMFKPDPGKQSHAEHKVEKPFIRDGEDDEGRRECKEDHHKAVQVVAIRIQAVGEWKQE